MPRYGFNFTWMMSLRDGDPPPADERALDFLVAHGFDFVRLPCDYRWWTGDEGRMVEERLAVLDSYLEACRSRGLHCCLNLHRAPGYSVNKSWDDPRCLWTDADAQADFVGQWRTFAARWRGIPADDLSFDLVNEPPGDGAGGLTRAGHETLVRATVAAIRAEDGDRPVVIDGLHYGNHPMPELADLGATQSTRGYQPMPVSHHRASWVPSEDYPDPVWPGLEWEGRTWDRDALVEVYAPWREVENLGVEVHVGEFGCFERTPHEVALAWLADHLSLYRDYRWGYALWNFAGRFGIVDCPHPGAELERHGGYDRVDRAKLDLLMAHRVD